MNFWIWGYGRLPEVFFVIDVKVELNHKADVHEDEGGEPKVVADAVGFLIVHSEEFDFWEDGDVVEGPVEKVAGPGQ